jgi:drug/metabolite transporter (DMT)-like permease
MLVYVQLAVGMILFGSATPVSKIIVDAMPLFVGSGLRVALGALVLAPFVWTRRAAIGRMTLRDWGRTAAIALFGMFGFTVFLLYGMSLVSGVTGSVIMATTPAVTAAAAILLIGESATWRKLIAIVLSVTGVLVMHLSGGGSDGGASGSSLLLGSIFVFAAVCCEATYTLLGRQVSRDTDPVLVAFLAAALSIPLFVPLALWQRSGFDVGSVDAGAWTAVIWYGAGTLALGTWFWYAGISKTQGSIAAAFMGLMPVSALVLSYVLLGEAFRWMHLAGFGIVFGGVLLISWEHARMSRRAA